ncbi:hypothetical protein VPHK250G1_0080 [Vibrio phage K250 g1]
MKKWELIVEANSFDGSQTFACEAETKEDALTKFKAGLCEIIEVSVEVLGLDEEPMDIEESECIESRLSQDVISRIAEENSKLKSMLKVAVDDVDCYGEFTSYNHKKAKDLLAKLNQ